MTPFEIKILLHYHCCTGDPEAMRVNAPIWRPTVDTFVAEGLLRPRRPDEVGEACYVSTERNRVFCMALQQVPLPVQVWKTEWPVASREEPQ